MLRIVGAGLAGLGTWFGVTYANAHWFDLSINGEISGVAIAWVAAGVVAVAVAVAE